MQQQKFVFQKELAKYDVNQPISANFSQCSTNFHYIEESFYYDGAAYACIAGHSGPKLINGFEWSTKCVEVLVFKDQDCDRFLEIHTIYIEATHVVNSELK